MLPSSASGPLSAREVIHRPRLHRVRTASAYLLQRALRTGIAAIGLLLPLSAGLFAALPYAAWRRLRGEHGHALPAPLRGAIIEWLLWWRAVAEHEREAAAVFRGEPLEATYRPLPLGDDGARIAAIVRDPATWRDGLYLSCVGLVLVPAVFFLALGFLAASAFIVFAFLQPTTDVGAAEGIAMLAGAVIAVPLLVHGLAAVTAALAATLLQSGERGRLRAEVAEQRARRSIAVQAAEAERRRIERDLHDGAQQRLISLAMHLGMARERLDSDPAGAAELVAEAHGEAKQALGELRDLARGIHPAVLADRGLDAALSALAARVGVPVDVSVDVPGRPPVNAESVAYFVVAEALTNVARHAAASNAGVTVSAAPGLLVVDVADDGVGGATPMLGTGLSGLADRLAAVDGRLHIDSPPGGPTRLRAEIPCAW